jgi:hypothetical protein
VPIWHLKNSSLAPIIFVITGIISPYTEKVGKLLQTILKKFKRKLEIWLIDLGMFTGYGEKEKSARCLC